MYFRNVFGNFALKKTTYKDLGQHSGFRMKSYLLPEKKYQVGSSNLKTYFSSLRTCKKINFCIWKSKKTETFLSKNWYEKMFYFLKVHASLNLSVMKNKLLIWSVLSNTLYRMIFKSWASNVFSQCSQIKRYISQKWYYIFYKWLKINFENIIYA